MKNKKIAGILLTTIGLIFFSANGLAVLRPNSSPTSNNSSLELMKEAGNETTVSGSVKSLDEVMTAWMYGTHLIVNNETGERFALESEEINLSEYNGETVTFEGIKVHSGLDTGPPLVKVTGVVVDPDSDGIIVPGKENQSISVNGTIKSLEGQATAWMYGTHLLLNNKTGERYALRSDGINLSKY
ncbi:MAG: hypothetical protein ABEJ72_10060, partial [Candidatus Aenigmatarchaeota archaeon]